MWLPQAFAAAALVASTAGATTTHDACKVAVFQKYIDTNGTNAKVQWARHIPKGGSFNPMNETSQYPTSLPESCGVQINVASEGNSSYLVGLIMPYEWNGRLLYVLSRVSWLKSIAINSYYSSAAAGGGINWVDMVSTQYQDL